MKGRDIYGFIALVPGVMDTNFSRDVENWNSAKQTTINGAPVNNKNLLVDGIGVMDEGGTGNAYVNPNVDAVGEIQIIANGYTAENGKTNGGTINMITKSGSTKFAGSAWYNAKRDEWNKNDYLRIRNGQPKPLYNVDVTGYTIGGPVIIPKVLDSRTSKKKVFFFFSQEYTTDAQPAVLTRANVATPLERAGNFSQTYLPNGTVQPIIDPTDRSAVSGEHHPGEPHQLRRPAPPESGAGAQRLCQSAVNRDLQLQLRRQPDSAAQPHRPRVSRGRHAQ